jgi:hypothetical protein
MADVMAPEAQPPAHLKQPAADEEAAQPQDLKPHHPDQQPAAADADASQQAWTAPVASQLPAATAGDAASQAAPTVPAVLIQVAPDAAAGATAGAAASPGSRPPQSLTFSWTGEPIIDPHARRNYYNSFSFCEGVYRWAARRRRRPGRAWPDGAALSRPLVAPRPPPLRCITIIIAPLLIPPPKIPQRRRPRLPRPRGRRRPPLPGAPRQRV